LTLLLGSQLLLLTLQLCLLGSLLEVDPLLRGLLLPTLALRELPEAEFVLLMDEFPLLEALLGTQLQNLELGFFRLELLARLQLR
jgi:hypothetical protein